jgi:hypothetical protein
LASVNASLVAPGLGRILVQSASAALVPAVFHESTCFSEAVLRS